MGPIMLLNQKPYFPDVIDMTMHFAYEVHWKGGRKEGAFDFLRPVERH